MKFRTEIELQKGNNPIKISSKILTIGSCFAENIGQKLFENKITVLSNPFGVLFNPASIFNSLKYIYSHKVLSHDDLIFDQGEWHSFHFHSDFSHHNLNFVLNSINSRIKMTEHFIKNADFVIITFGTSFIYKHIEKDLIVSNCHKIPADKFLKSMLSVSEAINYIEKTMMLLRELNNSLRIIFSVSPVRHWKDGANQNQLSKAILLLAVNKIVENYDFTEYFPAYELVMDDLRDYRFYTEDLVHPNSFAVDYIWEKFCEKYFSDHDIKLMKKISKISKAIQHNPRNPYSPKYKEFIEKQIERILKLKEESPSLNFDAELEHFNKQLFLFNE